MTKFWKYCSLTLAGERYDYILNPQNNEVYTQTFPGIPVEKLYTRCGKVFKPQELANLIKYKIGMIELEEAMVGKDYSKFF